MLLAHVDVLCWHRGFDLGHGMLVHGADEVCCNIYDWLTKSLGIRFGSRLWKVDRSGLVWIQEKLDSLYNVGGVLLSSPGEFILVLRTVADSRGHLGLLSAAETC